MRIILTGASRGIGRRLAQQLAAQGHELLLIARDPERLQRARTNIREGSGNAAIHVMAADLSKMREVLRLANSIRENFAAADILVNNHGGVFSEREITDEGLEMNFALNYLSAFLLTRELVPTLSPSARIINLAAEAHRSAKLNLDDLQSSNDYQSVPAYCQSKLMLILFTRALGSRLQDSGRTVVAVHPGSIFTDALHTMRAEFTRLTGATQFPPALPVEEGLRPLVNVILEKRNDNGSYYVLDQETEPSVKATNEELAEQLWRKSELILETRLAAE